MKKSKLGSLLLAVVMTLSMLTGTALAAEPASAFAGGSGTAKDPYQIRTAAQLAAVATDLDACYVLAADIDLGGEAWKPLGAFSPADETGEVPSETAAFSGTFDGNHKTVSNLNVDGGETGMVLGLFGCAAGAEIRDLTIQNASVTGNMMAAAAIGYAYQSTVDNVDLTGASTITGKSYTAGDGTPMPANMVAGVVGAGMDSTLVNCDVTGAALTMTGLENAAMYSANVHDAGLVGGGLEGTSLKGCTAQNGTVTVTGPYCFGIGGLSGCAMSAETVQDCSVTDVSVTVGSRAYLVGGLLGYTGTGGPEDADAAPSKVSGCAVKGASSVTVGDNSARVGGLVGGGFYLDLYQAYYPTPARFDLSNCTTAGSLTAGSGSEALGSVAGCVYLCAKSGCSSTMTVNGAAGSQVGTDVFLAALADTYQPLFQGATFNSEYDHYWHDYAAAVVGESQADAMVQMMKTSIGGTKYGSEAQENVFACGFTGGVATVTFAGSQITGYDAAGGAVFSHEYEFVREGHLYGPDPAGGSEPYPYMDLAIYQSRDGDSGEFTYFALCGDTPSTTYHIEFRYGSSIDELEKMYTGKYANWLAAGIPTGALGQDEILISNCIALFCSENLAEMVTPEARAQLGQLTGTWDADMETFRQDYPEDTAGMENTRLSCVLNGSGTGTTYLDAAGTGKYAQTDSYSFYAYDNSQGGGSGVYIAVNEAEGTCEASAYTVSSGGGKPTLTFRNVNGDRMISYTQRTPFTDVALNAFYADAVTWAASEGVTDGVTSSSFAPGGSCTRGQIVTFLWRAMGSPEPSGTASFPDVAAGSYCEKAVQWAVEQGIALGTSADTFEPNKAVTRAQTVTFLWRAAGSPAVSGSTFPDVNADSYYAGAVSWAVAQGVTNGTTAASFSPGSTCTRGQVVTFLYRDLAA